MGKPVDLFKIDILMTNNLKDKEIGGRVPFPSYTLKQLSSQMPKTINGTPVEVSIFDEAMARYDLTIRRPDILCVSALTPGIPRAYIIADLAKTLTSHNGNPIVTVAGGIHVTCLPLEALKHFDIVVRGEITSRFLQSVIEEAVELKPGDKKVFRLAEIPTVLDSPYFKWTKEDLSNCYGVPFRGSDGCPMDCDFCSVTSTHGAQPRYVSDSDFAMAVGEIPRYKPAAIFDDTILQSSSVKCIERLMLRAIVLHERKIRWAAEVTMITLNQARIKWKEKTGKDLLRELARRGLIGLYFGIESVDEGISLKKKITNQEAIDLIRDCRDCGISVLGAFVLGISPNETPDYAKRVLEFAIDKANLDMIQASIATPLPGSRNFITAVSDSTLLHRGWEYYDGAHCVFQHPNMTPDQLEESHRLVLEGFYSWKSILKRELMPPAWTHLWTMIPNCSLHQTTKLWPARRLEEKQKQGIQKLDPEVTAQVEKAVRENPQKPRLFDLYKPDDGISIVYK